MGNMSTFVFGTATKTLMNYLHKSDKKAAQIKKSENSKLMKKVFKSATSQYLKKASQSKSRQSVQRKKPVSYVEKKEQPWYKKVIESSSKKVNASKDWLSKKVTQSVDGANYGFNVSKDWLSKKVTQSVDGVNYGFNVSKDWLSKKVTQSVDGANYGFNVSKDWLSKKVTQSVDGVNYGFNVSKDWLSKKVTQSVDGVNYGFNVSKDWIKENSESLKKKVSTFFDITDGIKSTIDPISEIIKSVNNYNALPQNNKVLFDFVIDQSLEKLGLKKLGRGIANMKVWSKIQPTQIWKKVTDTWTSSKPLRDNIWTGIKNGYNSPTGKTIRKWGGKTLAVLDWLSPVNKLIQAKTGRERVEIGVSEILPKVLGTLAGIATVKLGTKAVGALGPEIIPFIPFAAYGVSQGVEWGAQKSIDHWNLDKMAGQWYQNWIDSRSEKNSKSISNKDPIKKNISTSTKSAQRVTTSKNNGSNHKGNPIYVNIPTGTVQISNNNHSSVDAAVIASQVGQMIATQFKRAVENQKPIHS